ncbi:hypothetical protein PN36_24375 [Candidatus Thiomargarita nelsonii]|uniref:Uncharacterized protein n=1 Tax=Candidatus Thiomargarita nelsonii TaxID=1003181 RepID=A0A4E0QZ78_9GAMM|nr:hypothetical protein PN36_24375 [Candidatus Thiomargarita nelsonii]
MVMNIVYRSQAPPTLCCASMPLFFLGGLILRLNINETFSTSHLDKEPPDALDDIFQLREEAEQPE